MIVASHSNLLEECGAHVDREILLYLSQMCSLFITIKLSVSQIFGTLSTF